MLAELVLSMAERENLFQIFPNFCLCVCVCVHVQMYMHIQGTRGVRDF